MRPFYALAVLPFLSSSELPAQAIGPFQVGFDLRFVCPVYRIKIYVLNSLDAWIADYPIRR